MISISKTGGSGGVKRTTQTRAKDAEGGSGFKVDAAAGSSRASAPAQASDAAPASALAALIDLQSEGGGRARNRAMAERTLLLLEKLRDGLLSGRIMTDDLRALADAASAKADESDPRLSALYEDIALRARVELAKMGR
ncbi:MAG: flagellar assembly protein FliX [Parvularculaceae bacterium]